MVISKKHLTLASLVTVAVTAVALYSRTNEPCHTFRDAFLNVGEHKISVALATTPTQQQQGLAGCRSVPAGHGMYFIFSASQQPTFWMKDMLIPIDIVWIADGTVVGIERAVPPPDYSANNLTLYHPPQPINAVLELAAGESDRLGLAVGHTVVSSVIDKSK